MRARLLLDSLEDDFDLEEFPGQTNFEVRRDRFSGVENLYGSFFRNGVCWIALLAVRPEARRSGVGRRALQDLEQTAKEHGCTRMEGDVLEGSEKFWEVLGYSISRGRNRRFLASKMI